MFKSLKKLGSLSLLIIILILLVIVFIITLIFWVLEMLFTTIGMLIGCVRMAGSAVIQGAAQGVGKSKEKTEKPKDRYTYNRWN